MQCMLHQCMGESAYKFEGDEETLGYRANFQHITANRIIFYERIMCICFRLYQYTKLLAH